MLAGMFLAAAAAFAAGYRYYGGFMAKVYGLDPEAEPPSRALGDGLDYVPAHPAVLTGHHFASIAGAGPIVGPIVAAALFGWLPAYLWCVAGSLFFGGPHDMGAVAASLRHEGKSIGEVVDRWIGRRGKLLYLGFTWLALVLVMAVFLQLSADTLAGDPAVAFSATLYLGLALVFGLVVNRYHMPLALATLLAVPVVLGSVWYGSGAPWVQRVFVLESGTWRLVLVGYVFVASVLPVWLLLQPRDYLASYLLYLAVGIGAVGMLFGGSRFEHTLPAFKGFVAEGGAVLWPSLFIIVACGAISGFHSIVASGTTSKQLRRETDAQLVGYGSMLVEGLLAVIAIGTVMMSGRVLDAGPVATFGAGFGRFAELVGIDPRVGVSLGLLAINSFLLTTLDTATRLGRYQLQELSGMRVDRYSATVAGVATALALLYLRAGDLPAWQVIWPAFGASNQLVAALALLSVAVWVMRGLRKRALFLFLPMCFMMATTLSALVLLFREHLQTGAYALVVVSGMLIVLAALFVWETARLARRRGRPAADQR